MIVRMNSTNGIALAQLLVCCLLYQQLVLHFGLLVDFDFTLDGEIGKRAEFKIRYRKVCGFDFHSSDHLIPKTHGCCQQILGILFLQKKVNKNVTAMTEKVKIKCAMNVNNQILYINVKRVEKNSIQNVHLELISRCVNSI